jgi:FxsC-like protein
MNTEPTGPRSGERAAYFFISYAHLPPVPPVPGTAEDPSIVTDPVAWEADALVKEFFTDLAEQVDRLAPDDAGLEIGLYDQTVATGPDLLTGLAKALGTAEVLVPLYSPRYVSGSWAMAERESFRQRLARAPGNTKGHVQPVLWVPLAPGRRLPDDGVPADIGSDLPEYAENGLRILCELPAYRTAYQKIVNRLAQRIVNVVRDSPLGPSDAPAPLTAMAGTGDPARFVIAVTAPLRSIAPPDRVIQYGEARADWRPSGQDGDLSVARQAASIAERLDLPTKVVDLPGGEDDVRRLPTVLLMDPWILDTAEGAQIVRRALRDPRAWLTAIVIVDSRDPGYATRGARLQEELGAMLKRAKVRHAVVDVADPERLIEAMPDLVMRTRRRFLSGTPVRYPERPSLREPDSLTRNDAEGSDQ